MFDAIISAVWSHLKDLITKVLTVPLLFDGFSNKDTSILPGQRFQLVVFLQRHKAG
jgi:hypothetical protein